MIIHKMKDGTIRQTLEGVVITNETFYKVLNKILKKAFETIETR